jgi:signal transduction histidine kinase
MEHMRPQLEKDGFEVEVILPEDPVTVEGDGDALSQVLLNLLSNAGKYGTAPDLPRSITVALSRKDGHAVLSVADRGPGVPRGHERRVFEKFQRAHNTLASGTAGSGLGLTIARRLAEAHKGSLEYVPRTGGGAEFVLTLTAREEMPVTA